MLLAAAVIRMSWRGTRLKAWVQPVAYLCLSDGTSDVAQVHRFTVHANLIDLEVGEARRLSVKLALEATIPSLRLLTAHVDRRSRPRQAEWRAA